MQKKNFVPQKWKILTHSEMRYSTLRIKGKNHGKLEDTEQTFLSLFGFSGNFSHYTKAKTKHKQIFMGYCIAKKRINLFR